MGREEFEDPYLKKLWNHPLLSAGEEKRLLKAAKHAETKAQRERAVEELARCNQRLIKKIAAKYLGRGLPLADLIQEGNLGLLRTVEKFDPERGFRFSTYATHWIRRAILRALQDKGRAIRLPSHTGELAHKIGETSDQLALKLGRSPKPDEIAKALNLPPAKVVQIIQATGSVVSLDSPVGEKGDASLGDFIEDKEAAAQLEESLQDAELRKTLFEVLNQLSPRERRILELRFGFADGNPHTLEEIGTEFGLTRERIRQIEAGALWKLRRPTRARKLQGFL